MLPSKPCLGSFRVCGGFDRCLAAPLVAILLSFGCQAAPPASFARPFPASGTGRFPTVARCTSSRGQGACPGEGCATNAVGAPDGQTVDLATCGTLDLFFTGGAVVTGVGTVSGADFAVHFAGSLSGAVRVEASADGADYVVVGFLNEIPRDPALTGAFSPAVLRGCLARQEGQQAEIDVANCNHAPNVAALRLSDPNGRPGDVSIDAVEALVFCERVAGGGGSSCAP